MQSKQRQITINEKVHNYDVDGQHIISNTTIKGFYKGHRFELNEFTEENKNTVFVQILTDKPISMEYDNWESLKNKLEMNIKKEYLGEVNEQNRKNGKGHNRRV